MNAAIRDKRRLVAAQRSCAEGVVLIHPFTPSNVLEDVGDATLATEWEGSPVLIAQVAQVGKERMRRIAFEGILDQPHQRVESSART